MDHTIKWITTCLREVKDTKINQKIKEFNITQLTWFSQFYNPLLYCQYLRLYYEHIYNCNTRLSNTKGLSNK